MCIFIGEALKNKQELTFHVENRSFIFRCSRFCCSHLILIYLTKKNEIICSCM